MFENNRNVNIIDFLVLNWKQHNQTYIALHFNVFKEKFKEITYFRTHYVSWSQSDGPWRKSQNNNHISLM